MRYFIVADYCMNEVTILNSNINMAKTAKGTGSKASTPNFDKSSQQMDAELNNMMNELEALRGGKKVAASRARKHANELKKLALQIRKEITEYLKSM